MNCDKMCIHYPCTRQECGTNKECKEYESVIAEAIKIIDKCNKEEK